MEDRGIQSSKKDDYPAEGIPVTDKFKPDERVLQYMRHDDCYRHHVRILADMGDPMHAYIMGFYC